MHIEPCFCGNTEPEEFIIRHNKMQCLKCPTSRCSSTTRSPEEMLAVWNTRGAPPIDPNAPKRELLEQMSASTSDYLFRHNRIDIASNQLNAFLRDFCNHHLRQLESCSPDSEDSD